ncbi:hypothetical protein HWV62_39627 [Athelia sp. TMB]|nr:hypothetical protein HWV62_39627 [Athelia sp. TMB]
MELFFSHNDPINTVLRTPDGQLLYKISTPGTDLLLPGKTTTIAKVLPGDIADPETPNEVDMQDRLTEVAAIKWQLKDSSVLSYDGQEVDIKEFMPAAGTMTLVGRPRTFRGPDDVCYKWSFGALEVPVLTREDDATKVIARFRRQQFGIIGKASKASLEISPAGEHMRDLIVITFVYVELLRRKRQRGLRVVGSASGA